MNEFRNRLRISVLVTLLVAVAVVSMVVDRRAVLEGGRELPRWSGAILDIAVPVQKMIAIPFDVVQHTWDDYIALVDVHRENRELTAVVARLEDENLQMREALVASGRLARIAEMRQHYEIPMLPSELVGGDVSPWFRSVLIDRGRGEGVRAGMPVISEQGLVGLVTAVSNAAAKATLLLDRQSAIDGTVQRSRSRGIVRGTGGDALDFEFVARDADVQVGDRVITSGLGGVYPKGLRIGEVIAVSEPGLGLMRTATVAPAVDFGRLEQIFVMLRRGPTMEVLFGGEQEAAPAEAPRS